MYMIRQAKKPILSKNKGFVLAEAMFAVIITLLIVLVLQNLLKTIMLSDKADHKTDNVVFAYVQFNRFLHDDDTKLAYPFPEISTSRQAGIVKVDHDNKSKIYKLNFYKNMVRVTTPDGGHMPLLLEVKKANFVTTNNHIKISITEKDNRSTEIYFKLDAKSKIKERGDKKIESKSQYLAQ